MCKRVWPAADAVGYRYRRRAGGAAGFLRGELAARPGAALAGARALGLPNDPDAIKRRASVFTETHAKDKAQPFSSEGRVQENDLVWHHHGDRIEQAVGWAATVDMQDFTVPR